MRIVYCTNVRLPSERAHGHQIAQVCDALVRLGHDVTVLCPYRRNPVTEPFAQYYGVSEHIRLETLGTFDPINRFWLPGPLNLWLLNWLFCRNIRRFLQTQTPDLLYTRSPALLKTLVATGLPTVMELHSLPRWNVGAFAALCHKCKTVACLTSPMRDELTRWNVPSFKLMVAGDAVDIRKFMVRQAHHDNAQTNRLVVGYVGRLKTLGMDKGVSDLLQALKLLQGTKKFFGLIVGGPRGDQEEYTQQAHELGLTLDDVLFTGELPGKSVPSAMMACDVLAMPWPDKPHYRLNMSPLKMFEYMAAGKPVVTSDLPTVRDVLSEETAVFCAPDDPASLAACLQWIADNPEEAAKRAANARTLVEGEHTWEKRMANILTHALST